MNNISLIIGKDNFYVVSLRRGNIYETKIQTHTENSYRNIIKYLDSKNKNYYYYQLKCEKGLTVVLKGIDSDVPIDEIKEALKDEGFEAKSIYNIINKNKIPQPMFKVEIGFDPKKFNPNETHPIYNLRYLLSRRITVEEPHKRRAPPQCLNCQEFGHTKRYCKLLSVCVICGEVHKTSECNKPKNEPSIKKCSNCGGNHVASYRGCPVYRSLREALRNKKQNAQYGNLPSIPNPFTESANLQSGNLAGPQGPINSQNIVSGSQSYSQVAGAQGPLNSQNGFSGSQSYSRVLRNVPNNISSQCPNLEEQIKTLTQTLTLFISNMQAMMQEMIANQSILIRALAQR